MNERHALNTSPLPPVLSEGLLLISVLALLTLDGEPFGKRPPRRVLDDILPNELSDHLRGRQILCTANLLKDLLLSRINQDGQPRRPAFGCLIGTWHVNSIVIAKKMKSNIIAIRTYVEQSGGRGQGLVPHAAGA